MANEGTVIVKLKDSSSIFHDSSQDNGKVTGSKAVRLKKTAKVKAALRGGVILEAKESDLPKEDKAAELATKKAAEAEAKAKADAEAAAKKKAEDDSKKAAGAKTAADKK